MRILFKSNICKIREQLKYLEKYLSDLKENIYNNFLCTKLIRKYFFDGITILWISNNQHKISLKLYILYFILKAKIFTRTFFFTPYELMHFEVFDYNGGKI